ncbi:hypothetical protein JCM10212_005141 [Sporobolomyces blumeae]
MLSGVAETSKPAQSSETSNRPLLCSYAARAHPRRPSACAPFVVTHSKSLPILASAAPQPASGGGFKLTLKLGGQSTAAPASASTASPAQVAQSAQPTYAAPAYHAPPAAASQTRPPYAVSGNGHGVVTSHASQPTSGHDAAGEGEGTRRVSADKYRRLKRKYLEAIESRDEAHLALYRAQKLIHRLRDDKSSLLDRVLDLEIAAGITSADVAQSKEVEYRTEHELAFPLLYPPETPSLEDRPRPPPVLTTSTDFTNPNYNQPVGPAPLPKTFPPRQRSHHLRTSIAAEKFRNDYDAQLAAQGLMRPPFPAVAVLGLEGSTIATTVERALAGEHLQAVSDQAMHQVQQPAARSTKRRRESSSGGARGKSRGSTSAAPESVSHQHLPNPFASAGAVPEGSTMVRNSAEALAASQAAAAAELAGGLPTGYEGDAPVMTDDYYPDDTASVGSGEGAGGYEDDGEDYKPALGKKSGRQSTGPDKPSRPKKVRQQGLAPGTFSVPFVPRNPDGTPRLPLPAGIMTLNKLGTVDLRDSFHTERYIFPVGYEAVRRYPSIIDRNTEVDYVCRIVDGGNGAPRFELYPADQPGHVIHAGTPTGAWAQVVRAANKLRERNHSNSVSGPDYYGLSNNTVKALIQELPGANQVSGYAMQTFIEEAPAPIEEPKAKKGKKGGRRKSRAGVDDSSYGIEVDDGAYDASAYGNGDAYAVDGSYDSASGYPTSMSPEGSASYGGQDYHPASLANLLQGNGAEQPQAVDPYSLPAFTDSSAFDPYAIPAGQPTDGNAFGAIDPAFGGYGAYDLPVGGQEYATSDASSP